MESKKEIKNEYTAHDELDRHDASACGRIESVSQAQQTDSSPPVYSSPLPLAPVPGAAPMTPEADGQSDRTMNWLPPGNLVQVKESQGIRYVSGGVGESERAELRALSDSNSRPLEKLTTINVL
jgi:hypothetical protein